MPIVIANANSPVKIKTSTAVVTVAQVRQEIALRIERFLVSYCIESVARITKREKTKIFSQCDECHNSLQENSTITSKPITHIETTENCIECHQKAYEDWKGSDHDLAMDTAHMASVLGDFNDAEIIRNGQTHKAYQTPSHKHKLQHPDSEPQQYNSPHH